MAVRVRFTKNRNIFDLVILDVMMENVSGYQVLQTMRAWGDHTPVMMLSGKSDEMDQVLGLGFGADSYLTKTISYFCADTDSKSIDPEKPDIQSGIGSKDHKVPLLWTL